MKRLNIFICLLSVFLLGADNPQLISYPQQKIMGFRGLDTSSTKPTVPDSRATDLQNVTLSTALDVRKRYGYDTINNQTLDDLDLSSPAITGLFDSEFSNGNSWTLAFLGSKLKYDNSGSWTTATGTATLTSNDNYLWRCIMALDSAICTNDVNPVIKINSTPTYAVLNVSDLTDALTKAKTVIWYRNYLIFGNTLENAVERPSRFRWSDVGTIETYDDDNFVDIATFAGDEIVGISELYGELFVFMTKSIWQVTLVGGDEIFTFKKIVDGIGSIARDSIQTVQLEDNRSAIIFLDERKKVLMFNGYSITDIGNIIQPTLDNLSAARLIYATSTFDGDNYYLSVTDGSGNTHDLVLVYNVSLSEWTKYTDINANAFAQVEETQSLIKTYFGNYDSMVYWLDNPNLKNDVVGAQGILEGIGTVNSLTITGAQILIDNTLETEIYTGAIVKITSGTGAGEEQVIIGYSSTSMTVAVAFTTTLDTTSVYSVGAIDAFYDTKWYDLGDSTKEKTFLATQIWAEEASANNVTVDYAIDFSSRVGSETISLSPTGSSLWDSALWDDGVWGTTGDKIYLMKNKGFGNFLQSTFRNNSVDESFHLYGFNMLAIQGDTKQ